MASSLEYPPTALGETEMARSAVPTTWLEVVTNGRMDRFMPPFASLTESERWDVTGYALALGVAEEELSSGKDLYAAQCASCHGGSGEGGSTGVTLNDVAAAAGRSLDEQYDVITNGRATMPGFAEELTEGERWSAAAYVRSLAFDPDGEVLVVDQSEQPELGLGTITGKIFQGTPNALLPAGLEVTLVAFDGDQPAFTTTTIADEEGDFSFEDLEFVPGRIYGAFTDHEGVRYFSPAAHIVEDASLDLSMVVFDSTMKTEDLVADRLHMVLDFPADGRMEITQLWLFTNTGDMTVVPGLAGDSVTLPVPSNATNLRLAEDNLPGLYQISAAGVEILGPIRPGETEELVFSFTLPYSNPTEIVQAIPLPVAATVLLTADEAPVIEGDGITDTGVRNMGTTALHSYEVDGLERDSVLAFEVSGRHPAATSILSNTGVIIAAGILGVSLILAGVYLWNTQRSREDTVEPDGAATKDDQLTLLQDIADLDNQFEKGEIPEAEYHQQRDQLKARLKEIMTGDDD